MSAFRILCVLVGLLSPALACGEEATDMFPIFQAICMGSDGDLAQAELLATAEGLKPASADDSQKVYFTGKDGAPVVVIQYASPLSDGMQVCKTFGTSMFLSLFLDEARARGMVELSPESVGGNMFEDQEANLFVQDGCDPAALSSGCRTMSAMGAPVEAGEFDGIFRLAIVPNPEG